MWRRCHPSWPPYCVVRLFLSHVLASVEALAFVKRFVLSQTYYFWSPSIFYFFIYALCPRELSFGVWKNNPAVPGIEAPFQQRSSCSLVWHWPLLLWPQSSVSSNYFKVPMWQMCTTVTRTDSSFMVSYSQCSFDTQFDRVPGTCW